MKNISNNNERKNTYIIAFRIPIDLINDLEEARKMTAALSISDLIRNALRHYLLELSILKSRKENKKTRNRGEL